jgi:hypothetical protein
MALSITDESEGISFFFVFDVSNGDIRFLLLLVESERAEKQT